MGRTRRQSRRQRGQTFVIVALALLVLVGFAGLAIDGGHLYLVRRAAQNATDAGALAAAKWLVATGTPLTAPPASSNDSAIKAAHDLAAVNGFPTALNTACDNRTAAQFTTRWFDPTVGDCNTTDFNTRVGVASPPTGPLPEICTTVQFNCVQVVITRRVPNFLMGVLGIPVSSTTTVATAFAQPAGPLIGTPPPTALYLYEPTKTVCTGVGQQCFDQTKPPSRTQLSCVGGNCPTFWAAPNTSPLIAGIDGTILGSKPDATAMASNGDMLLQSNTTICDPYSGGACSPGVVTGAHGFAIAPGAKLYCDQFVGNPGSLTGCTTTGQTGLATIYANETQFFLQGWAPTIATPTKSCGSLVLNGQSVASTGTPCPPPAAEPYTIQPGIYSSIVINHGIYFFETGLYDITGTAAPSDIQHGNETALDWDLCNGAPSCNLTAAIWIGHGNGPFTPGVAPTPGPCSSFTSTGGGGDDTVISGTGVAFRLRTGGFVSTHEVKAVNLRAPGLGALLKETGGAPILFDLENNNFIHLDAAPPIPPTDETPGFSSTFNGIIYQTGSASAGGVELNPGLNGSTAALTGQVLAYSFTTFGSAGPAIDFSKGFGTGSAPIVVPGGSQEQEILTSAAFGDLGGGVGQLVVKYNDEWALDAYNAYVQINGGTPIFFSRGVWNNPNPSSLPPSPNNPGDTSPARPDPLQDVNNQYTKLTSGKTSDWTYNFGGDGSGRTFRIQGNWTWGHEQDILGAKTSNNVATLTYTFPAPPGQTINVTIYMSDGDSCGDSATANLTFTNVSNPGGGQQTSGAVSLIQ